MRSIIQMRDVSVSFKGYNALEDINIDIPQSSFISVIGPNGAGKSTFIKLINGLQRPSSGNIRVMGKCPESGNIRNIRKNTGYISQERHNDPRAPVSVFEAVALGRYGKIGLLRSLTPSDRKAIERALKITGLDALSSRPVGLLSGGEKQKTAVARAIAQEPKLMLMDEPSTNLDLRSQRDIRDIIENIYLKEKVTIIYVTHILDHIPPSCSRTLMMKNGRIVWSGAKKDIYNDNLLSKLYGGDFYCAGGKLALSSVGEAGRV